MSAAIVKTGNLTYLKRYETKNFDKSKEANETAILNRKILFDKWKEGYFVLYENSVIRCFEQQNDQVPVHDIYLKDVCQYLAVGRYTWRVPGIYCLKTFVLLTFELNLISSNAKGRPNTSFRLTKLMVCFPKNTLRKKKEVCWIVFKDLIQLKYALCSSYVNHTSSKQTIIHDLVIG
jgi:hypothetical protein